MTTKTSVSSAAGRPTVFLSYSHRDEEWKNRVVVTLKALELQGDLEVWDDRRIAAGDGWLPEIEQAMDRAAVAVLLVSTDFLASRFIRGTEVPHLLKRRQEEGLRVIPLFVRPSPWQAVDWLAAIQGRPKDAKALSECRKSQADKFLADLALEIRSCLTAPTASPVSRGRAEGRWERGPEGEVPRLDLGRLPIAGPLLIGRETELARLDAAWEDPTTHVLTLVALGGMGKSALVSHWLDRMSAAGWRGARRVMDWSFYDPDTEEWVVVSADRFLDHALAWFGDPDPKAGASRDRGLRLADLVRQEKTLLVLDGVEPLQHPPSSPLAGRLKDLGMAALLKGLAGGNPGLCVVTTRERIADLNAFSRTAPQEDLEALSPEAGADLLKQLGVKGKDSELLAASQEFGNHALTQMPLGGYLSRARGGDIHRRQEVDLAGADQRYWEKQLAKLPPEPRKEPMKDFFVSFNKADRTWADWIAWTLEEAGYSVVYQPWDFLPGNNFVLKMQEAATGTRKTVIVLSESYLKAEFTQPEWAAAFVDDPRGEKRKLIAFRVAPCSPPGMLKSLIYADLVGLSLAEAKAALLRAVSDSPRAKPAQAPAFPGSAAAPTPSPAPFPGASTPASTGPVGGALVLWKEKLDFLLEQEALAVDAGQKFALRKQIEEARRKIQELGG